MALSLYLPVYASGVCSERQRTKNTLTEGGSLYQVRSDTDLTTCSPDIQLVQEGGSIANTHKKNHTAIAMLSPRFYYIRFRRLALQDAQER